MILNNQIRNITNSWQSAMTCLRDQRSMLLAGLSSPAGFMEEATLTASPPAAKAL